MIRNLLCYLFIIGTSSLFAQSKTSSSSSSSEQRDSLKTIDGKSVIYYKKSSIVYHLDQPFTFTADGVKYDLDKVKFFSSNNDYFEKFQEGKKKKWGDFYKRGEMGKITFYTRSLAGKNTMAKTTHSGTGTSQATSSTSWSNSGTYSASKFQYFQVGNDVPQLLVYNKLKPYLKVNKKSMELLNKAKNRTWLNNGLLVGGAAMAIYGFFHPKYSEKEITNADGYQTTVTKKTISPFLLVGAASVGVTYILKSPKEYCKEAVLEFNKSRSK